MHSSPSAYLPDSSMPPSHWSRSRIYSSPQIKDDVPIAGPALPHDLEPRICSNDRVDSQIRLPKCHARLILLRRVAPDLKHDPPNLEPTPVPIHNPNRDFLYSLRRASRDADLRDERSSPAIENALLDRCIRARGGRHTPRGIPLGPFLCSSAIHPFYSAAPPP